MQSLTDITETAAQLVHEEFHRAGSSASCDRCRAVATRIAAVYREDPTNSKPQGYASSDARSA